jgi:pyruvate formate lyase activating enzyme
MLSGRSVEVGEVMDQVKKDRAFYERSGGGVTVSGGEVLLQSGFAAALLAECKQAGMHTAVDTAGDVPYDAFEAVLPYTDLFLFDVKAADPALHRKGCGKDNRRILENLRRLSAGGANVRLRIPVIPGFNDNEEAIGQIGALICALPGRHPTDLLRFHRMGAEKYTSLQRTYRAEALESPDDARMQALADVLKTCCVSVQIQ